MCISASTACMFVGSGITHAVCRGRARASYRRRHHKCLAPWVIPALSRDRISVTNGTLAGRCAIICERLLASDSAQRRQSGGAQHGADAPVSAVLSAMVGHCPRRNASQERDRCDRCAPDLAGPRRPTRERRRALEPGGLGPITTHNKIRPLVLSVLPMDHREHQVPGVADVNDY